jgi:uncharacterized surface protein with fasciclin (FAS1) repeats
MQAPLWLFAFTLALVGRRALAQQGAPSFLLQLLESDKEGRFDTLAAAAYNADPQILIALGSPALQLTVLAPTDDSLATLGWDPETILEIDPYIVTSVLTYHALPAVLDLASIKRQTSVETFFNFQTLEVGKGGVLTDSQGSQVKIAEADIVAANGYLHILDTVLIPPNLLTKVEGENAVKDGDKLSTFMAAVTATNLTETLTSLVEPAKAVFIPTDEAFADLGLTAESIVEIDPWVLRNAVLYHFVPSVYVLDISNGAVVVSNVPAENSFETLLKGSRLTKVGYSQVQDVSGQTVDVDNTLWASNGIGRTINGVLLADDLPQALTVMSSHSKGQYDGLLDALAKSDLVSELSFPAGPYTFFAPSGAAFAGIPPSSRNTQTLLSHVVAGAYSAEDLVPGLTLESLSGAPIRISKKGVQGAGKIIAKLTDEVLASNGYIHSISAVLV